MKKLILLLFLFVGCEKKEELTKPTYCWECETVATHNIITYCDSTVDKIRKFEADQNGMVICRLKGLNRPDGER